MFIGGAMLFLGFFALAIFLAVQSVSMAQDKSRKASTQ
jgi:hypothetical protein